ncbi:MAG: hypothetical protein M5U12_06820 [Verrucomicrobia bacterium]|nr:hypothetical protein [Verrucomicrobiota bacterium]
MTSELNGVIDLDSVVFGTLSSSQPQIAVSRCGIVRVIGNYTIAAGGLAHVMAWGQGVFDCRNKTITVSGIPAFSWAFAAASECSLMMFNTSTFSGSATGEAVRHRDQCRHPDRWRWGQPPPRQLGRNHCHRGAVRVNWAKLRLPAHLQRHHRPHQASRGRRREGGAGGADKSAYCFLQTSPPS